MAMEGLFQVARLQLVATGIVAVIGAACSPLHQGELVPIASGGSTLQAQVISQAFTDGPWFVGYELVLHNATNAPIDVDLGAAQLSFLSMFDGSTVTMRATSGSAGELPSSRPSKEAPAHVSLGPRETRNVWVAFDGKLDPRARWSRRESLSLPEVGDILLDERGPDRPNGIRQLRARRFAVSSLARTAVDLSNGIQEFAVPYDLGVGVVFGDLRVDLHGGEHYQFETTNGVITRSSLIAVGPGVLWRADTHIGVYADAELVHMSSSGSANGAAIGAGIGLPVWNWRLGSAYGGWRIPIAQVKLGWVETLASGSSSGALRVGLELSPAWLP